MVSVLAWAVAAPAMGDGYCWPPSLLPVTHDITSARADAAPDLIQQTMRPIPAGSTQLAAERRVPLEPPPGIDDGVLQWEADETRAFLNKQLSQVSAIPTRDNSTIIIEGRTILNPPDAFSSFLHLNSCTTNKTKTNAQPRRRR